MSTRTNKKIDLAKNLVDLGVSTDIDEIQAALIQLQKDALKDIKVGTILNSPKGYSAIFNTLKYTLPTTDGTNDRRWAADLAKTMAEQRRAMYPELFESPEAYEELTGHRLRPITKQEKEKILAEQKAKTKSRPAKKAVKKGKGKLVK